MCFFGKENILRKDPPMFMICDSDVQEILVMRGWNALSRGWSVNVFAYDTNTIMRFDMICFSIGLGVNFIFNFCTIPRNFQVNQIRNYIFQTKDQQFFQRIKSCQNAQWALGFTCLLTPPTICIHLQEDDGGQYRCTARNEGGEVSLTMNLDIASAISVGKFFSK